MEQVKIAERRTEQMEITINPYGTIVCVEWTHEKKRRTKQNKCGTA